MRNRWKIAALWRCRRPRAAIAQQWATSGRQHILWNIVGLVGLLGLRGLWRDSDNDGYTDDPV